MKRMVRNSLAGKGPGDEKLGSGGKWDLSGHWVWQFLVYLNNEDAD